MRKFKLIKEYPGSPKLGYIFEMYKGYKGDYHEQPEFWEEIIEKSYEILSIISPTGVVYKKDSQIKDAFCYEDGKAPFFYIKMLEFKIQSVKRLSDGEIFTVGDSVEYEDEKYHIGEIKIDNNKIKIKFATGFYVWLEMNDGNLYQLKKCKKPLFTTEDGVEIFEGDKCWFIDDNFTIANFNYGCWIGGGRGKYFYSKAVAKEYITESTKIKIGGYPVLFFQNFIKINGIMYGIADLKNIFRLMDKGQVQSLNVGCQGQYKVDKALLKKIINKLEDK